MSISDEPSMVWPYRIAAGFGVVGAAAGIYVSMDQGAGLWALLGQTAMAAFGAWFVAGFIGALVSLTLKSAADAAKEQTRPAMQGAVYAGMILFGIVLGDVIIFQGERILIPVTYYIVNTLVQITP